ncbi:MAG: GlsB/YeaQ/YmgE family stress response membrane protein [Candidatus Saccharibacteria bacterium]
MSLVYWIIFGLLAGAVASFIMPGAKGGILGLIVLGIIGAVVGGFFGQLLFGVGVTGFNLNSFIVAVIGSLLVIYVGGLLAKK